MRPSAALERLAFPAAAALAVVAAAVLAAVRLGWDPSWIFLADRGDASWIRAPRESQLMAMSRGAVTASFRRSFSVDVPPARAPLRLQGLKALSVELNAAQLGSSRGDDWKTPLEVDLAPQLRPGHNELVVRVTNDDGPPLLIAESPELGLHTDSRWQTRVGRPWGAVALARHLPAAALGRRFDSAAQVFLHSLPLTAAAGLLAALGVHLGRTPRRGGLRRLLAPSPAVLRWLLMAAMALLGLNNLFKLPLEVGMDASLHTDAIRDVLERRGLLDPTASIQHFQAPLYYVVSALYAALASNWLGGEALERSLRLIPILLGLGQVELCYRALGLAFPERADLQRLGLLFGGLLPLNLYMTQVVGNEPMVAVTAGATLVVALRILTLPAEVTPRTFLLLGLLYGLALLSKVSALVLLPALAFVVLLHGLQQQLGAARTGLHLVATFGTTSVVAGWFFVRNRLLFGRWLFGSSQDATLGFDYWQDPGYRMIGQYLRFGEALQHPFYSAMTSFWDGIYASLWSDAFLGAIPVFALAPPWNYGPLLAGLWLALLPSAALLLGLARGLWPGRPAGWLGATAGETARARAVGLSALCAVLYLLAILTTHLSLPIYSVAKASYAMAIIPCLAVLAAAGLEPMLRRPLPAALVSGGMITWAGTAYLAFFVR